MTTFKNILAIYNSGVFMDHRKKPIHHHGDHSQHNPDTNSSHSDETHGKIETGIDHLIQLIEDRKKISVLEASIIIKVPMATVKRWAALLEEKGGIHIHHSLFRPPQIQLANIAKMKKMEGF